MPPGMAEMQGEMSIAFSQLKSLNKKVSDLTAQVASLQKELARLRSGGQESGEPKPPAMPV